MFHAKKEMYRWCVYKELGQYDLLHLHLSCTGAVGHKQLAEFFVTCYPSHKADMRQCYGPDFACFNPDSQAIEVDLTRS